MSDSLKILYMSAEAVPFAKLGGLADVAGSLPKVLRGLGHDVRVVIPAYQNIEKGFDGVEPMDIVLNVPLGSGVTEAGVFQSVLPGSDVPIYFIAEQNLFDRPEMYGYEDDPYRFAFFSRAALELAVALDWKPDVVHGNDWHAAPAITWLNTSGRYEPWFRDIASVFTIHNLLNQGHTYWGVFDYLRIETFSLEEEQYGEVNFMARAIYHAQQINTVSDSYARDITTSESGMNLDGLLRYRKQDLYGIINGLDYGRWNPSSDPDVPVHFNMATLDQRAENKRLLQQRVGLPIRPDVPLYGIVSRMYWQKGFDILPEVLRRLLHGYAGEAQVVVLGSGEPRYEHMIHDLVHQYPNEISAFTDGYYPALAPFIYAGVDMFLMPSLFEPCGLAQLIAMHYGCVPIVRATGGLADTVVDNVNGFSFHEFSVSAFWNAIQRANYIYNVDKARWQALQREAMRVDYSWEQSAEEYVAMYKRAIGKLQLLLTS